MSVHENLIAAKALIGDPARWTRGALARDKAGVSVQTFSPEAVCWCAVGAVYHVRGSDQAFSAEELALCIAAQSLGWLDGDESMASERLNDFAKDGHPQVMKMFDIAIAETAP